jgi:hypothetical protein
MIKSQRKEKTTEASSTSVTPTRVTQEQFNNRLEQLQEQEAHDALTHGTTHTYDASTKKKRVQKYYKEANKRYLSTPKGIANRRKSVALAKKRYPERHNARESVRRAVKSGKLIQLACEMCGNFLSFAHHPDYNMPLAVVWLCRKHHRMADTDKVNCIKIGSLWFIKKK